MKNFGKVLFSTGLALSLGTFLITSPLFAETAKTDKPAAAADAPAGDKMEKKEGDKAAAKPMKKKGTAKTSTGKKKAAKKDEGAMKPAEEKKADAPAAAK